MNEKELLLKTQTKISCCFNLKIFFLKNEKKNFLLFLFCMLTQSWKTCKNKAPQKIKRKKKLKFMYFK